MKILIMLWIVKIKAIKVFKKFYQIKIVVVQYFPFVKKKQNILMLNQITNKDQVNKK